jgi:hypothetical protein
MRAGRGYTATSRRGFGCRERFAPRSRLRFGRESGQEIRAETAEFLIFGFGLLDWESGGGRLSRDGELEAKAVDGSKRKIAVGDTNQGAAATQKARWSGPLMFAAAAIRAPAGPVPPRLVLRLCHPAAWLAGRSMGAATATSHCRLGTYFRCPSIVPAAASRMRENDMRRSAGRITVYDPRKARMFRDGPSN